MLTDIHHSTPVLGKGSEKDTPESRLPFRLPNLWTEGLTNRDKHLSPGTFVYPRTAFVLWLCQSRYQVHLNKSKDLILLYSWWRCGTRMSTEELLFFRVLGKTEISQTEWQCQTPDNSSRLSVLCCLLVGVINRYRPRTSGGTRAHSFHTSGEKRLPLLILPLLLLLLMHFPGHNPGDRGLS